MAKKIFRNILLVDGSDRSAAALETASELAKATGARLTVADVREGFPGIFQAALAPVTPSYLKKLLREDQKDALASAKARLKSLGVRAQTLALDGRPFIRVIQEVARKKYDLVIKASEGGVRNTIFGSTDKHLLRKCPCPVWIAGPAAGAGIRNILAAVDPDPFDAARNSLNEKILSLATGLARALGCGLHVAHAWALLPENLIRARGALTEPELERLVDETRLLHEQSFEGLLAKFRASGIEMAVHVIKGEPAVAIPELARRRKADLIVMGTIARTGVPGLFIGNTAERMLARVCCSVLAVKPDGFVTPVKP